MKFTLTEFHPNDALLNAQAAVLDRAYDTMSDTAFTAFVDRIGARLDLSREEVNAVIYTTAGFAP